MLEGQTFCPSNFSLVQVYDLSCPNAFVGGEDDAEAVDGVGHEGGEVGVVVDRVEEETLLAFAELLVVGLVGHVDPLVGLGEVVVGVDVGVVDFEGVGFGVLVDIGAVGDGIQLRFG